MNKNLMAIASLLALSLATTACTTTGQTSTSEATLQDVCTAEQITKQPKMCNRMLANKQNRSGFALYPDAMIPSGIGSGSGVAADLPF